MNDFLWYLCKSCNKPHPLELDRCIKAWELKQCETDSYFALLLDKTFPIDVDVMEEMFWHSQRETIRQEISSWSPEQREVSKICRQINVVRFYVCMCIARKEPLCVTKLQSKFGSYQDSYNFLTAEAQERANEQIRNYQIINEFPNESARDRWIELTHFCEVNVNNLKSQLPIDKQKNDFTLPVKVEMAERSSVTWFLDISDKYKPVIKVSDMRPYSRKDETDKMFEIMTGQLILCGEAFTGGSPTNSMYLNFFQ